MEQDKIKAVKEWKIPTKIKEVESFLGFANFYRRFIQNFSYMAKLLILSLPKREGKFRVETDASRYAIGGVLSQEQEGK